MLLLLAACSIFLGTAANEGPWEERGNCLDGEDNDEDGLRDCDDDDCDDTRACGEGGDADADTDADTDSDTERCGITLESTVPANNSVDAYYRAPLEFVLSGPDETARIETAIPGTLSRSPSGEILTFTPSAPLVPSTSYTARLHGCFGTAELSFTTSALGTPVTDPSVLEGRVYAIDLTQGRWVEPPGIGPLIASEIGQVGLLGVTSANSSRLSVLAAVDRWTESRT